MDSSGVLSGLGEGANAEESWKELQPNLERFFAILLGQANLLGVSFTIPWFVSLMICFRFGQIREDCSVVGRPLTSRNESRRIFIVRHGERVGFSFFFFLIFFSSNDSGSLLKFCKILSGLQRDYWPYFFMDWFHYVFLVNSLISSRFSSDLFGSFFGSDGVDVF